MCDPVKLIDQSGFPEEKPPNCVICRLNVTFPDDSGCLNIGKCEVTTRTFVVNGASIPYTGPWCSCQPGWAPPQCLVHQFSALPPPHPEARYYRAFYCVAYVILMVLCVLEIIEHVYYARTKGKRLRHFAKVQIAGLCLCFNVLLFFFLYHAINPQGVDTNSLSQVQLFFDYFFINMSLASMTVAVALITSTWLSLASVSVVLGLTVKVCGQPLAKIVDRGLIIVVVCITYPLAIFFAAYTPWNPNGKQYFLIIGCLFALMLIANVTSGILVLSKVRKTKLAIHSMRKMVFSLNVVAGFCLVSVVTLIIIVFLPESVFTSFWITYFVATFLNVTINLCAMIILLLYFRRSVWKNNLVRAETEETATGNKLPSTSKQSVKSDSTSAESPTTSAVAESVAKDSIGDEFAASSVILL